ncbi:hypothetical protein EPO05_02240 [Patescibacteria group bacterium]|nr:MAG: hypothetical protein EPO05_02240 [Patescibacteria group bacterium]
MEPFGEGNEEPVFLMKNLIVHSVKTVGNGNKHLKLQLRPKDNSPKIFEAIGFRLAAENVHLKEGDVVSAVFNLSEDSWNGNRRIQMKLIDLRAVEK